MKETFPSLVAQETHVAEALLYKYFVYKYISMYKYFDVEVCLLFIVLRNCKLYLRIINANAL